MSYTPTVSILTTVYNRERYLAECIESVQNGHYQDYEHIIVDDGSTDRSVEIAKAYAASDQRIRFYHNQENLGDYPNRNKAASFAKGKYIKYLDADDMHGRFMVEMMVDAMAMYPEAGFALFDYGPNKPLFPILLKPAEAYEAHYSGKHRVFSRSPINAIMKKDVFDAVGGFSGKQHLGDFELWHLLARETPLVILSAGPGLWREHDDQQSKDNRTDPTVSFKYQLLSLDFLSAGGGSPLCENRRLPLLKGAKRKLARTILYAFKRHGIKDAVRLKKASKASWSSIIMDAFSK
jgi:glycosyltransferase involved in cell wall biosynthesis